MVIQNSLKAISIALIFLTSIGIKAQPAVDGYLKGKGNLDLVPGISYESFGNYYGRLNETTPINRSSTAFSIFSAYGITKFMDVQVNIPYIYVTSEFSGLQDIAAYLKIALLDKYYSNGGGLRLMLSGGYSTPMTDYETENVFAIGQQATAYDARFIFQVSRPSGFFFMGQGGYTHRLDPTPSSYPTAIKVGWAKSEYYLDVWYDQQIAIGGNDYLDYRDEIRETGSTDITFRTLGVSYGKLGLTYYRPFWKSSGMAFGGSYVLWGRNVGQAFMVSAAFVKRFSFSKE